MKYFPYTALSYWRFKLFLITKDHNPAFYGPYDAAESIGFQLDPDLITPTPTPTEIPTAVPTVTPTVVPTPTPEQSSVDHWKKID